MHVQIQANKQNQQRKLKNITITSLSKGKHHGLFGSMLFHTFKIHIFYKNIFFIQKCRSYNASCFKTYSVVSIYSLWGKHHEEFVYKGKLIDYIRNICFMAKVSLANSF